MDLELYLRRIKYSGEVYGDLPTLRTLLHHHVFSIPFENLDIHNRTPIVLQIESIYRKVIPGKRGGYCFELNLLFHRLLQKFGYTVSMVSGRLLHGHGYGPEFEHMALIVELEGRKWLVDAGYGDFSLVPLAIQPGEVQSDGRTYYQVTDNVVVDGEKYLGVVKWNHSNQAFRTEYIFTLVPRVVQEFAGMNHFHQTSPESHFARSLICTLPTKDGRITIINNKLTRTAHGKKQVMAIQSPEHREELLRKYFQFNMANASLAADLYYDKQT
jgi:N-hydroxyarylamine O-acetyltransferase